MTSTRGSCKAVSLAFVWINSLYKLVPRVEGQQLAVQLGEGYDETSCALWEIGRVTVMCTFCVRFAGTPEDIGMPEEWPRTGELVEQWILQAANVKFAKTHNLRMDKQP